MEAMLQRDMEKAALRGEPSYVWRAGQHRIEDVARVMAECNNCTLLEQ
jgi:hypothetical protein